jgi:hypothetical protein
MRQRIDIDDLWTAARRIAESALRAHCLQVRSDIRAGCPFKIDNLLANRFDFAEAAARAKGSSA